MSFWRWLFQKITGRYDPAVEKFRMRRSYFPIEGERLITGLYQEVERLDQEIETQRLRSKDVRLPAIDQQVARAYMRNLNAQRANRIGIARQIENRIVGFGDEHDDVLDEESGSPRLEYIENFYYNALLDGRETIDSVNVKIHQMRQRSLLPRWKNHIVNHLTEMLASA